MLGIWWPLLWPLLVPVRSTVGAIYTTGNGPVNVGATITIGAGGDSTKSNGMISAVGDLTTSWVGTGLIRTTPR